MPPRCSSYFLSSKYPIIIVFSPLDPHVVTSRRLHGYSHLHHQVIQGADTFELNLSEDFDDQGFDQ